MLPTKPTKILTPASILFAIALLMGCKWRPNNVVYVFPDGFRGVLQLTGSQPDGTEASRTYNSLILIVPASGILRLRGPLPTRDWNSPSARYANGEAIPIFEPRLHTPNGAIALRPLGTRSTNEDWFVVGTAEDAAKAQERMRGFKWP